MTRMTRTTAAMLALAAVAIPTASASVADKPVHQAPATASPGRRYERRSR